MLTPASPAMRLVLALSKPSRTKMRAVASISASTVARDRCWDASFLRIVSGLRTIHRAPNASIKKRVIARIMHLPSETATADGEHHDATLLPTHGHEALGRPRPLRRGEPELRAPEPRGILDHAAHPRPHPYGRQNLPASSAGIAARFPRAPLRNATGAAGPCEKHAGGR